MDIIVTSNRFLGAYSLFLIIFGSCTNFLSFVVCIRKRLRKNPTFVFISHRVVIDILALLFVNIDNFYQFYYDFIPEDKLKAYCNVSIFLQIFAPETSVWLLVVLTVERCLSVRIKVWRTTKFNSKKALIVAWLTILVIFTLNFHTVFLGVYVQKNVTINDDNQTFVLTSACKYKKFASTWIEITSYVYSIIPFILLGISNCFLIHAIRLRAASTRDYQARAKRKAISLSVIVFTIAFVVFTLPNSITYGYFLKDLLKTPSGIIILASTSCLSTTYHSLNFTVLVTVNKHFLKELKTMLCGGKRQSRKVNPENRRATIPTILENSL